MTDLVITWPKTRPLSSYLEHCQKAHHRKQFINFRIGSRPKRAAERVYVVYDGAVRGWHEFVVAMKRRDVRDPQMGTVMEPGLYLVRRPTWHPLATPIPMKGFQGWRYFDRPEEVEP